MIDQQLPPKTPIGANGPNKRWQVPVVCLVLATMTFAVFGQELTHEFVNFDDDSYVYDNPVVAGGLTLKGIAWAFSFHAFNWHPLTWLSHMLDCQLYGLHPAGHHLTNVLLHTATVIALFLVLRTMTGALWRSAFVAAVFAIHPLRVESVAWVAERKDVLSGLFFMLTVGAYVLYAHRPWSWWRYGLVVVLFGLGLMSKPMLVTLPLVLLLLDYWPLQRKEPAGRLMLEKLPLLALSAASCVVTILAQHEIVHSSGSFSLLNRMGNALETSMVYLRQMVYPARLAVHYPFPQSLSMQRAALAGILLAGLSAIAWKERRTRPWLLTGWLWYLVMLLPVIGVIQVGRQAHADRYTYLPQIGIYVAITWLVAEWRINRVAGGGLMIAVLAALMVCAWKQNAYWKDSETLWTHTLVCNAEDDVAHWNLGKIIMLQNERTDEAIAHFEQALKIDPNYYPAYNTLGSVLMHIGRWDEAISRLQEAVQLDPGEEEPRFNLGVALLQQGKVDEAIAQLKKVLEINPASVQGHVTLSAILLRKGRADEAIAHYQQALKLDPANPNIQNNLAWVLAACPEASLRNGSKAVELARQANTLTGGEKPAILHTLAAACAEAGRFSEAVETAQRALHLAEAQSNTNLAAQLQLELKLYQAGKPFHLGASPNH